MGSNVEFATPVIIILGVFVKSPVPYFFLFGKSKF